MTKQSPTGHEATILVMNGPNLNLLGEREPELYGRETIADLEALCRATGDRFGIPVDFMQSNHEGELIDRIHAARGQVAGIVLNAAAYTHTSVAIRDALAAVAIPFVEVHLTNVYAREPFRHQSYLSPIAESVIAGAGSTGYVWAVQLLAERITQTAPRS